jgi:hypothetical protein
MLEEEFLGGVLNENELLLGFNLGKLNPIRPLGGLELKPIAAGFSLKSNDIPRASFMI